MMITAGVDPNGFDADGFTPLIASVVKGHLEVAQYLLTVSNIDAVSLDSKM
jgi:ankyrin repeat protein